MMRITKNPLGGMAAGLVLMGTAFLSSRGLFGFLAERRRKSLRSLLERLVSVAMDALARSPAGPALPPGEPSTSPPDRVSRSVSA
jgi:hypothetical protein